MIEGLDLPYSALVDSAPDGVLVCDLRGTILFVNAQTEQIFGYPRGALIGTSIEQLIPAALRAGHASHLERFGAAPRTRPMGIGMELVGVRRDGGEVPIEISLAPVQGKRGMVIAAGIRDVTERRELEHANRRANAYLVSAVDSVADAFALFDEQDRVMMVNSVARQLLGGSLEGPMIGVPYAELLEGALRAGTFDLSNETRDQLLARWLAYHANPQGTLEFRTGTGRYMRLNETRTAEHGTVSTVADITDDVLRAEELEAARRLAEAASAAKSEFLSSMSHELRTPLNAILGFAQLLERDRRRPLDERQLERLGHVLRGGQHLLRLIDDVLDLSRIEAGRVTLSVEPVHVHDVIAEVVATLAPLAERNRIALLAPAATAAAPRVLADRTRLAQILMNFGSNAIKYGKAEGHATFAVEAGPRDMLRIVVADDGIGIPVDMQDKVFEPFHRAGQESGPIEGTGIGLTITRRLAEMMSGRVGFASEVGRGSRFWVEIPTEVGEVAGAMVTTRMPTRVGVELDGRKVIYIEDNPSNIAFMRELLDELPGVELITAANAELGIELVRSHLPDVVIMDVNLPGMSGLEATQRLRADPATANIPVIGLSAAALLRDATRAKEAGFTRYLTKPVQVDELLGTLDELLSARSG